MLDEIDQLPITSAIAKLQGLQVDASYGLNPTPQSPIGSESVDVKGEISHPTLNMLLKLGDCYSPT